MSYHLIDCGCSSAARRFTEDIKFYRQYYVSYYSSFRKLFVWTRILIMSTLNLPVSLNFFPPIHFICTRWLKNCKILYFVDRASRYKLLLITNLTHFFMYLFIYFVSLHVSSITVLIIRRSNWINTSSGMISLRKWVPAWPAYQALTYTD